MKQIKLLFLATLATLMSSATTYAEPNPNFHIYLCFGQSNMEGHGLIEEQDKSVNSRFQVLCTYDNCDQRKRGCWYDAVPPLSCCIGERLGPIDYFGRTLVKNLCRCRGCWRLRHPTLRERELQKLPWRGLYAKFHPILRWKPLRAIGGDGERGPESGGHQRHTPPPRRDKHRTK